MLKFEDSRVRLVDEAVIVHCARSWKRTDLLSPRNVGVVEEIRHVLAATNYQGEQLHGQLRQKQRVIGKWVLEAVIAKEN